MSLPVVIIGAGLSGLLTGYRLKQMGFSITILEARARSGGRINTVKSENDTPLEMGATWFGPQHQNFNNLLEELEIPGFEQYNTGAVIFQASSLSPPQRIQIPPQDPSFRIVGGTGVLIQKLETFFDEDEIYFKEEVKEILFHKEQVEVKTNNRKFMVMKVICCIPPALLVKTINFFPELPESFSKEAKITHTWMQESIKAGLSYETPFWKDRDISTLITNEGPVIEFYDHSNAAKTKFALCGFLHPVYANLAKEERKEKVVAQLKNLLGEEAGNYLSYEEVVWKNEKFTSIDTGEYFLPHQNNGNKIFHDSLYEDRLWISNSETSEVYGGYMEGAVYSANLVAERIKKEG